MDVSRRAFLKAQAANAAAAAAGISLPAQAQNIAAGPDIQLKWSKAPCRFCGTGCGVMVGVKDGKVVATHGDMQAEVNRGLNCVKGYFLSKIMYGADRLTTPLMRMKDGRLRRMVRSSRSRGTRLSTRWPGSGSASSRRKGRRRSACSAPASGPYSRGMPPRS